jgi:hypothetical protein
MSRAEALRERERARISDMYAELIESQDSPVALSYIPAEKRRSTNMYFAARGLTTSATALVREASQNDEVKARKIRVAKNDVR